MQMQDQIAVLWLPLVITVAFGLVGLLRGAMREAVVAASVVLATLVVLQWGQQWGEVLHDLYTGISQPDQQFGVSVFVFWLIVLVIGYGLGAAVLPKQPLSAASRLGGGLLGLASGAAVAGWSLRYAITNIDGTLSPGLIYDNPVSRSFMIWGNWFPVLLVFLAALLILIGPVRRAQRRVATPSAGSDWSPATPQPSTTTQTQQLGAATAYSPPPAQAYDPARVAPYGSQWDAPPTRQLPAREVSGAQSSPTRDLTASSTTQATRELEVTPSEGSHSVDPGTYSSISQSTSPTPSWLLEPVGGESTEEERRDAGIAATTPYATTSNEMPEATASDTEGVATTERKCSNCGSVAVPGAIFCTECGSRLT
jgi:hypothetical protein